VGDTRNSYFAHTLVNADTGWNQALVDAPDALRRVATLSGCAVMIRRVAIEDVGGSFLEPTFFTYYEETDFFARALRLGWDLYYLPEAAVWHRVGASMGEVASHRYTFHMERNRIRYAYRNFEDRELRRFEASLRRKIRRTAWRRLLRFLGAMDVERNARWEAWAWYRAHLPELVEERAGLIRGTKIPYNAAVRALQSCAEPLPALEETDLDVLVSIVIANHNYGRFLGEAIESALGQTHPRVEVIVVDDGSTDNSLEIAGHYPVRVVPQANQGVSAARNHGAAHAKGKYLVFLDADDLLEPNYVTRCLQALKGRGAPVVYVYTGMHYFGSEDKIYCSRPFDPKTLLAGNYVHASALMLRSAFQTVGGFDPTWRLGHEDYELWIRMLHHGFHGVLVPEPLLNYRRHGVSRNVLSRAQQRELRWRMRFLYPGFYWRKLLKDPIRSACFLFYFRGRLHRRRSL